jgi:DNA-binding XRE family transcriptional regulator
LRPATVGDHIKVRRLDLGLTQAEAGARIGTDEFTVINWEKGKTAPGVRFYPAIIRFLGSNPLPAPTTLEERIRLTRMSLGLSKKRLASRAGVDESTVAKIETEAGSSSVSPERVLAIVDTLLRT